LQKGGCLRAAVFLSLRVLVRCRKPGSAGERMAGETDRSVVRRKMRTTSRPTPPRYAARIRLEQPDERNRPFSRHL
jgi:hypothetical protein